MLVTVAGTVAHLMSRPARNRLLVVVIFLVALVVSPRLPTWLTWVFAGVGFPFVAVALWVTTPFRAARKFLQERNFERATLSLVQFEHALETGWKRGVAALAVGFYTSSARAAARSLLGAIRLEEGRLDDAKRHCDEAIALDDAYAIPWANLAVLAAMNGEKEDAARLAQEAVRRGLASKPLAQTLASLQPR